MVSSGIRIGAWDYLRWKNVKPLTNDKGEIIAAKLTVYAGIGKNIIALSHLKLIIH